MKVCSICNVEKKLNDFYSYKKESRLKGRYTYYNPECKECSIERQATRQLKNHEAYIKYQRDWNRKNKKKLAELDKRNYRKNKERHKRYLSAYQKTEVFKENNKSKYALNRKRKQHNITLKEWDACRLYFDYRCAYCGITYEDHFDLYGHDLHKEHLIHEGRNDLKNCVPSCKNCNSEKSTSSLNRWYNIHNPKYTRERYLKIYQWIRFDCLKYIQKKRKRKKENQ